MQHLVLYFKHEIGDIIPWSHAVERLRQLLAETGAGEYLEDDMAIDGGDTEAVFCGPDADVLYETISPLLKELPFLWGARITRVYGSLNAGSPEESCEIRFED
ncbi:MAG: hypothetical protein K8T25_15325 [Planctomycetia bacterium]|nr:hypothetical protein [Planctomycetia bacterium]